MADHLEDPELIPMRADEQLDPQSLQAYLKGKLPNAEHPLALWQFEGGKANLTYLLRFHAPQQISEYVLRRPPLGPVAPRSHDMGREYRVLSQLWQAYPLAPRAWHFCEHSEVIGAPFVIMERRTGIVIRQTLPSRFAGNAQCNQKISEMIVDALADLHRVDPPQIGLETLGRPEGFMERQIKGWHARWEGARTADSDAMHDTFVQLSAWLLAHIPPAQRSTLVHNDFKLDNMLVGADDPTQPIAVLDWDMCTIGDPLADVGTLLSYWTEPSDDQARQAFAVMPTQAIGFLSRAAVVERYQTQSGLDLSQIGFYEVFGLWKVAVVIQQIYARWYRGQTQDHRFQSYAKRAQLLIDAAQKRQQAVTR